MDEEKCMLVAREIVEMTLNRYFKRPSKKERVWGIFQKEMKRRLMFSDDEYDAVIDNIYEIFEDINSLV